MERFGIGQAVRRREDERFLTGAPGVIAVYTAADYMQAGYGPFPTLTEVAGIDEHGVRHPERHALASGTVRFVGDAVAFVIAETRAQARDTAELVDVEYEDLDPVIELGTVLDHETPVIWPEIGTNLCYTFHKGDEDKTQKAIDAAAHVIELDLVNSRLVPSSIETRGAIGDWNAPDEQYVLYVAGQAVHAQKGQMAGAIFKVDPEHVRVIGPDVGGGFGAKNFVYPENVLVCWAAKKLGRPVKWVADRSENFLSEIHGRDHLTKATLAVDANGKFTALKVDTIANMGAYLSSFATIIPTSASWVVMGGIYDVPAISMHVRAVFTNTVPVDAYRGAGRPEAAYIIERLVDLAAHKTGIDRLELRRKNLIRSFPYTQALGMVIDCGAFEQNLDLASQAISLDGLDARKKKSARRGRLRGVGVATYLEVTLGNPAEATEVRFEEDGTVTLAVSTQSTGQGHETAYLQLLDNELGIPADKVAFLQADTGKIETGGGHGGSSSLGLGGTALLNAATEIRAKGTVAAAHFLDAAEANIDFDDGLFTVRGTNRTISLLELSMALLNADELPDDVPASLTSKGSVQRDAFNYPNGCHMAEVEIDPETGVIDLVRYVIVDDFGKVVNPMIAEGQAIGGTVQGIGQALLEATVFDPASGQLLSGSYMD